MKKGWEYKKLGEVCRKSNNIKWDDVPNDASYRYIDLTSVDRSDLCIHNPQYIKKDNAPSRAKQIIKAGDIIFATTRPTLRRVSIIDEKYDGDICSTGFCVLRPNVDVKSKLIFYALLEDGFYKYIEPLQTGANYPAVTDNIVKNYIIPVPPLSEQQSIVDYLDSAFAKIDAMKANAEKALNEAKALFQASLKEMLEPKEGWEEKTLREVCSLITDGTHHSPPNNENGKYKYITAKNIKIWGLDLSNITYVSEDIHKEIIARCYPQKGDVLYIKDGATTGIAIVNPLEEEFSILSSVALIKPNKEVLSSEFLCYTLNSPSIYNQTRNQMDGAAITRVTLVKIKGFVVPIPPISEQQRIVLHLDSLKSKVDRLQENYEKISQECDALKQAILRQVFE